MDHTGYLLVGTFPVDSAEAVEDELLAPFRDDMLQTAQKQHAGSLEVDTQPSAARIRLPGAWKVSAPARQAHIPDTSAASGPEPGTWKNPDPRRRSNRGPDGSG